MEATHITSNPRSGKLGMLNKDDDDDDDGDGDDDDDDDDNDGGGGGGGDDLFSALLDKMMK